MNTHKEYYQHTGELARLLGHASRIEILDCLISGECSVEMLVQKTGIPVASMSQHLQNLRRGQFVNSRREGKYVFYRLSNGPVMEIVAAIARFAAWHNADIRTLADDYQTDTSRLEAVTMEELLQRLNDGSVTLLDVRPEDEFADGHLPGALNIPLSELEARLSELPAGSEIVAYCRGAHCVLSGEAVELLRAKGFSIRRFSAGIPEWLAAGQAVERAD